MRLSHVRHPCPRGRSPPFSFCWYCYENRKGRAAHPGHRYYPGSKIIPYVSWSSIMKRPSSQVAPKKGSWSCPDAPFFEKFPTLASGMCDAWWDDGKPREVWSLTVRFEAEAVHLCVNDKEASMGLYTTGESLEGALELLESCLANGSASWRRWKKK